jgi:hypothetical protein
MEQTHVRIFSEDLKKLNAIREVSGFKSNAFVIHNLIDEKADNIASVERLMDSNVPVVLTGKPLSGKSTFIKTKLLPALQGSPVLVIDSLGEYNDLKTVSFDIFGIDFEHFTEHIRFVPNGQSMVAETEVGSLFSNLDMRRGALAKWTIITEEAHAYKNVSAFTKFLYGSRHYVRKMVVVTPQSDAFQGLSSVNIL